MSRDEGTIAFPPEWVDASWDRAEILQVLTIKRTGERMFFAGGHLADGTCLYGLAFPGGQRVMRLSPATNWAVEERFKGTPPKADGAVVNDVWRRCVQSMVVAKRETEAVLGRPDPADLQGESDG